jgi:hypothetical protein
MIKIAEILLNRFMHISIEGDSNQSLASGLYGYQLANAAEIMRSYSGWSSTDYSV